MDLTGDLLRGHSDLIVLSILNHKDSYGYEINKLVDSLTDSMFQFTEATLYTTFKRLEKNHFISAYWQDSPSGRKRKYYTITDDGLKYYKKLKDSWDKAKDHLERIITIKNEE